jgi:twitching motility two-component system response regulator PilH
MARILIVDDSPTQIFTLRKIVEKMGHTVTTANSGEEGVQAALKDHPDLILMDVVMPGMGGFKATRQITHTAETQTIPVILVTTKNQQTDEVWGLRQGAKAYLTKPVVEAELQNAINSFLGGKK